nr:immunoglobulin light chain junction region [Macaca mulatta]MOW57717.1 immunoglobulin light chain junction region [Macaca mulatta]MOW58441.1 immunoglobulin light chain junction region [Macaca mulatta]MOW58613.1 immunoglobulin light chain junction region [Macaca mulatta]MOW59312.1 immunoglobulin light chain junction region [Macaca mulatta]
DYYCYSTHSSGDHSLF